MCSILRPLTAIHHIDFGVSDFARSREFYTRALAPLGLAPFMDRSRGGCELIGFGVPPDPVFWIRSTQVLDGRLHVAFLARSRAAVDGFHAAALAAGGHDQGAPGLRDRFGPNYYAAYVLDPDGHNIEAVCRGP